jgi:cytokinin riboside 5'-monophosphate phosphoribohydrolase
MPRNLCIYCSSSTAIDPVYLDAARELGTQLVARGWRLVYGGANIGLMGVLASAVTAAGGQVTGIIPEYFAGKGLDYAAADELLLTRTMSQRKMLMAERADAFLALPGGFGTLEELLEVITLKQLDYHNQAIVILNTADYFRPLLDLFQTLVDQRFAKPEALDAYHVATTPIAALDYLDNYRPTPPPDKWR